MTAPLPRRVAIAADLLTAAPRADHALLVATAAAAAVATWPFPAVTTIATAVPATLALAAATRAHLNRRDDHLVALTAAGAQPADLAVIRAVGPVAATGAGVLLGVLAALAVGEPQRGWHALLPLAALAVVVRLRAGRLTVPALSAGAAAATAAAAVVLLTVPREVGTALVASAHARSAAQPLPQGTRPGPAELWSPALTGLAVLVAAQLATRPRTGRASR